MLYLMRSDEGLAPPSQAYFDTIRDGYQDFGIDKKFLNAALKHAWDEKQHSEITRGRRERQKQGRVHRAVVTMPESVALRRQQMR